MQSRIDEIHKEIQKIKQLGRSDNSLDTTNDQSRYSSFSVSRGPEKTLYSIMPIIIQAGSILNNFQADGFKADDNHDQDHDIKQALKRTLNSLVSDLKFFTLSYNKSIALGQDVEKQVKQICIDKRMARHLEEISVDVRKLTGGCQFVSMV